MLERVVVYSAYMVRVTLERVAVPIAHVWGRLAHWVRLEDSSDLLFLEHEDGEGTKCCRCSSSKKRFFSQVFLQTGGCNNLCGEQPVLGVHLAQGEA